MKSHVPTSNWKRWFQPTSERDEAAVYWHLKQYERARTPLLMEVEQCLAHFRCIIAVRGGLVVASKPNGLNGTLAKNAIVRLIEPAPSGRDLRMKIVVPHFNLNNGSDAFMCALPTGFAGTVRRKALRFNTTRFRDFRLQLFHPSALYPVQDVSLGGARVGIDGGRAKHYPLNVPLHGALLHIGKAAITFQSIVPRVHGPNWMGVEFKFAEDGKTPHLLELLIRHLEKADLRRALDPLPDQRIAPTIAATGTAAAARPDTAPARAVQSEPVPGAAPA